MNSWAKFLLPLLAAIISCTSAVRETQADPIQGSIDFGGVVTFDTTSLATATRVDLWNSSFVLQRTGDFVPVTSFQQNVTMAAPWIFTPSTPLPALWSVGGFTFDLSSSVVVSQSAQFLNIQASGILTGNGFDPTPAFWTFTASRSDGANRPTFGFQSRTVAIPEAGSAALGIGGALTVGFFLWRRKRMGAVLAIR